MDKTQWTRCLVCGNKTRNRFRKDTILKNYLFIVRNADKKHESRQKICKYGLLTD